MAITVELAHVSKRYRLSHEKARSFQDVWLGLFKGKRAGEVEEFWALQDVSLHIEPGETLALIGPMAPARAQRSRSSPASSTPLTAWYAYKDVCRR